MTVLNKFFGRGRILSIVLLLTIAFFFQPACHNSSGPVLTKEKTGNEVRIVSLVPSLTESIYYLEAQDLLVGCSSYCKPAKSDSIEVAGSVIKPNIEKIVSLKPGLVLISEMIPENDVRTLKKFGIRTELFASPHSFEEICSQFIKLGKLTGKEKKAQEIVQEAKAEVRYILAGSTNKTHKPRIFIQIGASPIFTAIPNTFMDDYITYCGGINIAERLKNGETGREFVIAENPDFIFIVTMGIAGEAEKEHWNQFRQIKAVSENHVYIIDSDIACQPTPVTFIETLTMLNKYLNE